MRRQLRIRVVFEPVRLSAEHLRSAYERAAPVAAREVRSKVDAEVPADDQEANLLGKADRQGRVA